MSLKAEDVALARKILREWKVRATIRGSDKAKKEVDHLIRVIDALAGGKS